MYKICDSFSKTPSALIERLMNFTGGIFSFVLRSSLYILSICAVYSGPCHLGAKDFQIFFGNHMVDPPPPVANIVREKFLLSGKKFFRGPWNGRGPKFWTTPPNQKPVGTALCILFLRLVSYPTVSSSTYRQLSLVKISRSGRKSSPVITEGLGNDGKST